MAALIDTKTLVDIARHKSKLMRLSMLMEKMDASFLVGKMAYIFAGSDPVDLVLALDEDINSTVKMIKEISVVVDSVDDNGVSIELGDENNDLAVLFPKNWDSQKQSLLLFGHEITKGARISSMKTDQLKAPLYDRLFGDVAKQFPYESYKKHLTILKSIRSGVKPDDTSPFIDLLRYSSQSAAVKVWQPFYAAASTLNGSFRDFRKSLSDKQRRVVDEKVYSGRAMIDGVVKSSTYITKASVDQTAIRHKKNPEIVAAIKKLVDETPFISGVEIDQDTDIVKFHDVLVDMCSLQLDFAEPFEVKSRKTGNYKASGLNVVNGAPISEYGFASFDLRIVAADVDSPTSFAHELSHYRDVEDTPYRSVMIDHFKAKIDSKAIYQVFPKMASYFLDEREVIARMGEIGFLLNQYGYKDGETMSAFEARVSQERHVLNPDGKQKFNINLTKDLSHYLGVDSVLSKNIYFDMANWSPEETSILRDYTRGFFYGNDPARSLHIKDQIDGGMLVLSSKKYQEMKNLGKPTRGSARPLSTKEELIIAFGKISPEEFGFVYQEGVREGFFNDGEFVSYLSEHVLDLFSNSGRNGTKSGSLTLIQSQADALLLLAKLVDVEKRPGDALMLESFAIQYAVKSKAFSHQQMESFSHPEKINTLLSGAALLAVRTFGKVSGENGVSLPSSHVKLGAKSWKFSSKNLKNAAVLKILDTLRSFSAQAVLNVRDIPTGDMKISLKNMSTTFDQANWIAITELFKSSFKDASNEYGESTYDWQTAQSNAQRAKSLAAIDNPSRLSEVLSGSGLSMYVNLPKLRADSLSSLEFDFVQALVRDDWFSDYSVKKETIVDLIKNNSVSSFDYSSHKDLPVNELFLAWAESQRQHEAFDLLDDSSESKRKGFMYHLHPASEEENVLGMSPLRALVSLSVGGATLDVQQAALSRFLSVGESLPALKSLVSDHLDGNVKDFNDFRKDGLKSINSRAGVSINHPWALFVDKLLMDCDMDQDASSVFGNDLFKVMVEQSFLSSVFEDGVSGELLLTNARCNVIPSSYNTCVVSLKNNESFVEGKSLGVDFCTDFIRKSVSAIPVLSISADMPKSVESLSTADRQKAKERVSEFLGNASRICPETTELFTKAIMMFSSQDGLWKFGSDFGKAVDDLCNMSAYSSVPFLENGQYYENVVSGLELLTPATKENQPSTRVDPPKIKAENPELNAHVVEAKIGVHENEAVNDANRDVAQANGEVLKREHQMKLSF